MASSQNGWGAIPVGNNPNLENFPWVTGRVRSGDVYTVLNELARRFNSEVEGIRRDHSWGWAYRNVRAGQSLSNHASGTAVDFNAPAHPLGRVNTFNPAQRTAIRRILNDLGGVVRWGGDYTGRKDEMHFEINASAARVAQVAQAIRSNTGTTPITPPAPAPVPEPEPEPIETDEDEEIMKGAYYKSGNTYVYFLFNERSGFYSEFGQGPEKGAMPASYNNTLALNWETGSWPEVTKDHARQLKADLALVRQGK